MHAEQQPPLDDTRWSAATSLIEEALDASGSALGVIEMGDDVLDVRVRFARFLRRGERYEDLMREYFTVYHPLDEAMPRARRLPHAQLVHVRELYTEDEFEDVGTCPSPRPAKERSDSPRYRSRLPANAPAMPSRWNSPPTSS